MAPTAATWKPTHRLIATMGQPKSVHCWLVMVTPESQAFTRHDWANGLTPSLQKVSETHWLYRNPETGKPELIATTLKPINPVVTFQVDPTTITRRGMRRVS